MIDYKNPGLIIDTTRLEPGQIEWRSPSNIALIKYWGKHGRQLPRNPSISFTLETAYSQTMLEYEVGSGSNAGIELTFLFNDQPNEQFAAKVRTYLESITDIFPFLKQLKLTIRSTNSFPHSAGIASSASGMSALALCICSLEDQLFGTLQDDQAFRTKASYMARLGSGSACRSIFPKVAVWGESTEVSGSSDLFAVACSDLVHPVFHDMHDDILIVSAQEKSVSSRAGHGLMEGNVFAEKRYEQAKRHFHEILGALQRGDLEQFGRIVESEALTLHALMMASNPSYILMEPNTIRIIQLIRAYREESKHPIYFTLDAGPNIHLLYPHNIQAAVSDFISSQLKPLCANGQIISDRVGPGPVEQ